MTHLRGNQFLSLFLATGAILLLCFACEKKQSAPPAVAPTTTAPATTQAEAPPLKNYTDILRLHYPRVAATQPLEETLEIIDSGHFILTEPVYVCSRGDLWVTHPDAPDTQETLKTAAKEQTHLVRDAIVFVHWFVNEDRKWEPAVVVDGGDGSYQWIGTTSRRKIGRNSATQATTQGSSNAYAYRWDRAQTWGENRIVVPTDRGISIFTVGTDQPTESNFELAASPTGNEPQFTFDDTGVLAWIPWDNDKPGSLGAARFANNKWTALDPKSGFPQKLIHLVPLLDGSILELVAGDYQTITLNLSAPLSAGADVDEKKIRELVAQMSNPDPNLRKTAFDELQRYGNASWPILEKLQNGQPLETRVRIRQLLQNRIQPTLGGRTLVDNKGRVASRLHDGGVVIYASVGVSVPRDDGTSIVVNPAWISIRPGSPIELLDEVLVRDADPDQNQLFAQGDDWILSDDNQGPKRLEGNHLQPLLSEKEAEFSRFIAIDSRGRWLFRKPAPGPTTSTTKPDRGRQPFVQQTLILDSTIPDPRPRLPIWTLYIKDGQVGWQRDNWPVIKRPGAWMLTEYGWQGLDEKTETIIIAPPPYEIILPPPSTAPATMRTTRPATTRVAASSDPSTTQSSSQASTQSAMAATTQASTQASDRLLLIDAEGRRYFDGMTKLTVVETSGKRITWPLPASAVGKIPARLTRAKDGALFLYNAPGRILKIVSAPIGRALKVTATQPAEPFKLDATFTHNVPNIDNSTRFWIDPANRIIMAYDTHLAIMFPEGRIPQPLSRLIPAAELEDQEP
jgi:hypothetical protein